MKMLMHVTFPHEPYNTLVKKGTAVILLDEILEEIKPFSAWFTEENGRRAAILIVNVTNASVIPIYSEPFHLNFNADVHFRIAMSPEDLANSGLEGLGKKWN
ncbi:hypothetical protein [Desulfoluna sp.]|uniref:hypothetical protein n=1 Tax=Desulfoluna sp. TaxID=2045199 RepID=UPI00261F39B4|nr:hypothetical protein [Desulfoluna sp.]